MKVAVGMSGGVDSSVAALILKEQGHEIFGVSMAIWGKNNTAPTIKKNACFGPDEYKDIEEAQKVCDLLGIPFYKFDCSKEFKNSVLKYFQKEYISGKTPNPCIRCNHMVKIGALPDIIKQAKIGFDAFATGHYAICQLNKATNRYILKKAKDLKKDQSYFLYRLSQKQLANLILPLGKYLKSEVRNIAKKHQLPVHSKCESQDFYCGDYRELLNIKGEKEGNIVDKTGNILGKHGGIWNYTLGQRRGLGVSSRKPLYVIRLNRKKNEVVVGHEEDTYNDQVIGSDINWVSIPRLGGKMKVTAKIRSTQAGASAVISPGAEGEVFVKFNQPQRSISPGQSVVFYDADVLIGGGIING